ncbi:MAG: hypothetical protein K2X87_30595 [Gemmataceae bacterium]|nr:hypothetical protein [Gemmataceae bacterium]
MPEQRNPYRAGRPWLRLGFMTIDGTVRELELVADTGSPGAVIVGETLFDQLVHDRVRDRPGRFGTHRAGWVRLYSPELALVEFVLGYGNDDTARTAGRSSLRFAGLVGLPILRLGEYGGNADAFWFRYPSATPPPDAS